MTDIEKVKLTDEIKAHLGITWNDESTDNDVKNIVNRGIKVINGYCTQKDINYLIDSEEKELFFNYCRYSYNKVLELFEVNFKSQIISLRHKYLIEAMKNDT